MRTMVGLDVHAPVHAPTCVAAATCHWRGRSAHVAEAAGGGFVALARADTEKTKREGEERGNRGDEFDGSLAGSSALLGQRVIEASGALHLD
jgi:hypothetical protein